MTRPVLHAREVRRSPGLEYADLTVMAGEHVALVGPNGAGKTTLLRLLGGLLPPEAGQVLLDDKPMHGLSRAVIARTIAWLSQSDIPAADMIVGDYIALGRLPFRGTQAARCDSDVIAQAVRQASVGPFVERRFSELSGGEKQRVMLARCLAQSPRVLLLDEPTNHLDLTARVELLDLLRTLPLTVVAILHDLTLVPDFAKRTVLMSHGNVVLDGPSRHVLFSVEMSRVFGLEIEEITLRNGRSMLVSSPVS